MKDYSKLLLMELCEDQRIKDIVWIFEYNDSSLLETIRQMSEEQILKCLMEKEKLDDFKSSLLT